jgi:hypothetical protein
LKTQKKWKNEGKFFFRKRKKNVLAFQNRENWKKRQKNPIFFLLLAKFLKKQKNEKETKSRVLFLI